MTGISVQDVVVTLGAMAALLVLVRPLLPRALGGPRRDAGEPPCAACASGQAANSRRRP